MSPSWDPAIPQAMQQHGGRNRPLAFKPPTQEIEAAVITVPKGTRLQVVPRREGEAMDCSPAKPQD